jgi:hypothetical protein
MSNEERTDEMSEETRDESKEETEETDDYSYDTNRSGSGGGSSAGIWVIIILVVIALIGLAWYQWDRSVAQKRAEEAAAREQIRETQLRGVAQDVPDAEAALERGDMDAMIDSLRQMDQKLQIIATAANQAGDSEAAQRISAQRAVVKGSIDDLAPLYDQLKAQQAELQQRAQERLQAIRGEFGVAGPTDEPMGEGEDSAAEPAGEGEDDVAPPPAEEMAPEDAETAPEAVDAAPPVGDETAPGAEEPVEDAAPAEPVPAT